MKYLKELCLRTLRMPVCLLAVCLLTLCLLAACGGSEETEDTDNSAAETVGAVSGATGDEAADAGDSASDTSGAGTWEDLYTQAKKSWVAGDYEETLELLEQALEMEPAAESLYLLRAWVYYDLAREIEVSEDTIDELQELCENGMADTEKAIELIDSGEAAEDDEEQLQDDLTSATSYYGMFSYDLTQAKSSVKNAWGSTVFEYREEYQEFDEFSADQQAWIETLLNACVDDTLKEVPLDGLDSIFPDQQTYYTAWNSCKVWFDINVYSDGSVWLEVEIRPENGLGYYASIDYDAEGSKYGKQIVRTTCPCVDWQWNGEYNSVCTTVPSDYEIEEWGAEDWIVTTSGTMTDSMRTGTFTSSNNTYFTYDENGKLTDTSENMSEDYEFYGTMRAERSSFTEEYGLLMLYW